jgi:predicted nuclease with TOPRIM domain
LADGEAPQDPQAKSEKPVQARRVSDDEARDALHILPLSLIPLDTPGLQNSRLIKNVRLETVVELFNDKSTGSGQVKPAHIPSLFESYKEQVERDLKKINKIATASSFDVYSMRIELRRLEVDVNNHDELTLSDKKKAELTEYMKSFTHPLIQHVYGSTNVSINDVSDIIRMFAAPNRDEAIKNLRMMADRLKIELVEIPNFLEEYGDIFLSLAYFRRCIDELVPEVQKFTEWMIEIRKSSEIARDQRLIKTLEQIAGDLTEVTASITGRFENFDRRSKDFWTDINADTFRAIRSLITSHHVTIGGVLCGLAVKMNLWKIRFARGGGGPNRRMEFIKSEILPGLSHIKNLEQSARRITD